MGAPLSARKKKALLLFPTILFGTALGIGSAEFLLRIAGPAWLRYRMEGTNLEGDLRYGSDAGWPVESLNGKFLRFKPETDFPIKYYEYSTVAHTDAYGGRVVRSKITQEAPIVPFFGDSFTFGLGVNDEETFVSLIAEKSAARVLNLGVPGSSLPNQLDIMEARYKQLSQPDFCIFVFYLGNDFTDMMKYYYAAHKSSKHEEPERSENLIFARSYLYQLIAQFAFRTDDEQSAGRSGHGRFFWTPDRKRVSNSIYLLMSGSANYQREAGRIFDETLDRVNKLANELNFHPFFIIIPDKHQTERAAFEKNAHAFSLDPQKLTRSFPDTFAQHHLNEKGIPSLDLFTCFTNLQGMYYEIDDHLTSSGHKKAAECILEDHRIDEIIRISASANMVRN